MSEKIENINADENVIPGDQPQFDPSEVSEEHARKMLLEAFDGSAKSWQDFCLTFFSPMRQFFKIILNDSGAGDLKAFELFQKILEDREIPEDQSVRLYIYKMAYDSVSGDAEAKRPTTKKQLRVIFGKPIWNARFFISAPLNQFSNTFEKVILESSFLHKSILGLYYYARLPLNKIALIISRSAAETEKIFIEALQQIENAVASALQIPFDESQPSEQPAAAKDAAGNPNFAVDCHSGIRKCISHLPFPQRTDESADIACFTANKELTDRLVPLGFDSLFKHLKDCDICESRLLAEKFLRVGLEQALRKTSMDAMETQALFLVREKLHLKKPKKSKVQINFEYVLWLGLIVIILFIIYDSFKGGSNITATGTATEASATAQIHQQNTVTVDKTASDSSVLWSEKLASTSSEISSDTSVAASESYIASSEGVISDIASSVPPSNSSQTTEVVASETFSTQKTEVAASETMAPPSSPSEATSTEVVKAVETAISDATETQSIATEAKAVATDSTPLQTGTVEPLKLPEVANLRPTPDNPPEQSATEAAIVPSVSDEKKQPEKPEIAEKTEKSPAVKIDSDIKIDSVITKKTEEKSEDKAEEKIKKSKIAKNIKMAKNSKQAKATKAFEKNEKELAEMKIPEFKPVMAVIPEKPADLYIKPVLKPSSQSKNFGRSWGEKVEFIKSILNEHSSEMKEGPLDIDQWVVNGWITLRERIALTPSMDGKWYVVNEDGNWNVYVSEKTTNR
ncbi:MAG: hypothetical protein HQM10_18640 [Candidatus Riflebacteria bacterium]|nr:hypothetical protein [Candidatus Riflebacteria bacterium]